MLMNANAEISALFNDAACLEMAMGLNAVPAALVHADCDCSAYYPSHPSEENEESDSCSLPALAA